MADRTTAGRRQETQRAARIDLGAAYGLIGGAGVGAILLGLTGDVLWMSLTPAVGLLVGLIAASALAARRGRSQGPRPGSR